MDAKVQQNTRVRETADGKHFVANAYDGKILKGPFDAVEDAMKAQASLKAEETGPKAKTPRRDPETVHRTSTPARGTSGKRS